MALRRRLRGFMHDLLAPVVNPLFFRSLIHKTHNFGTTTWLGQPIWQNLFDLWTIQETIAEVRPSLLIETGTNRGGSSMFFANLFDLLGHGEIITIDVEKLHALQHPRITYLIGSSTAPDIVAAVRERAGRLAPGAPVMAILDSDHAEHHVRGELDAYAPLVTRGSYCLVQDGVIDTLGTFRDGRPGPLPAIRSFLREHPEFTIDRERCDRYLVTHHPQGWLKRA